MPNVKVFSLGKSEPKNEDFFGYTDTSFIVADGSTDKSGRAYNGKTGGEIISRLVVEASLNCKYNGVELVDYLNKRVSELYFQLGLTEDVSDPKYRFSCYLVLVRIVKDKIIITCLGDVGFRLNQKITYKTEEAVDTYMAEERSKYIQETGDIEGSRNYIMPLLLEQFKYQNNAEHEFGYGIIDGTETPSKFIKFFEYNLSEIKKIELFSDGYFDVPSGSTIKDWESMYEKIEKEDPDKYLKYKSTKSKDDRTVMIVNFN